MPVNRSLFGQSFSRSQFPNWRCPRCDGGHLRLVDGSFHHGSSGDTVENSSADWFDFDMVELRFCALLRCDNAACKETASVAGRGFLVEDPDLHAHRMDYSEVFQPNYVHPSPPLIRVPKDCPDSVRSRLAMADTAQWSDPHAAAGHLRSAIERLLDDLGLETARQKAAGSVRLSLHERIELLRAQRPQQADALLATKWIGNAGVHEDVTREDVFDMMDILERVLDEIYGHAQALAELVKTVNSRKGPAKRDP